ncbi:MAG: CRISPR-associated ring nuclease Csm6 [Trichloromonas sp.]|jgi:CRISPR-associated protein Csx14|nr:CRISPR-associated ring nuclease Csm6 [Trichloromonas sp.]
MKTILLALCGLTPQVITETLYALHQEGRQIDAIRVLTTRFGKDACLAQLFRSGDGHFYRYLEEYGVSREAIDFAPRHLQAVMDENGSELDDISGEEASERFLRLCMEAVFELTADPQCQVLISIAGGRKTMGASLSLAAQCYARRQDRIYHVLVEPAEFESCRDFFYPPKEPRTIAVQTRDRRPCHMSTDQAEITLVPMPFFPLRAQLTPAMLLQPESPAALMLSLVREDQPLLVIDLPQKKIVWKRVECDLPPSLLAFYALLALHKQDAECDSAHCRGCDQCYLPALEILARQPEMTRLYQRLTGREPVKSGATALDEDYVKQYRAKLNRLIRATFGDYEARRLQVGATADRPGARYGIGLERALIRVVL